MSGDDWILAIFPLAGGAILWGLTRWLGWGVLVVDVILGLTLILVVAWRLGSFRWSPDDRFR